MEPQAPQPESLNRRPPGATTAGRWLAVRGWTRRRALGGAIAAGGTCLGAGSVWSFLRDLGRDAAPADVFKGDAPSGELWELWRRRGWVHEARHYLRLDRNVQCKVCPNNCLLTPGDRSHCRNKVNHDGTLYTLAYANPCTFHVDPVEKKPLFHFLPGSSSFSLATAGCVFRCLNCQNWEISQKKPEETKDPRGAELRLRPPLPERLTGAEMRSLSLFPEDLGAVAAALGCRSVSYTYSEPTAYYEYACDASQAVRRLGLKNVLVSCGSIEERPLRELAAHIDAAHVDLKGFDDAVYRKLNSGRLEPILSTLRTLRAAGVWVEIVHLVVPTYTDRIESIRRMCDWVVTQLGPDVPLHFSRFHPQHKLAHLPPTPAAILLEARAAAHAAGLRYVYLGNVAGLANAGTTFCPGCRRAVIERDIFSVTRLDVVDGRCRHCGQGIPGVWGNPAART
jgi:pyruvate formate lyase activating enzyme